MAYRLVQPPLLVVHNVLYILMLWKYIHDVLHVLKSLTMPFYPDATYEEQLIHILDHKEQQLGRRGCIS